MVEKEKSEDLEDEAEGSIGSLSAGVAGGVVEEDAKRISPI